MQKAITTNKTQPGVIAKSGKQSKHLSSNKIESEYLAKTPNVIVGGTKPYIDTANVDKMGKEKKKKKARKSAKKETMTGEKKRR